MTRKPNVGIKMGESLPEVVWPSISRIQIACMAGATEDYNPMYIDEYIAKAEGFGGIFANPLFLLALFEHMLERYHPECNILSLNGTFQRLVRPGDFLTGKGSVSQIQSHEEGYHVDVELWAENQRREIVAKGAATFLHIPASKTLIGSPSKSPKSTIARASLQSAYKIKHANQRTK